MYEIRDKNQIYSGDLHLGLFEFNSSKSATRIYIDARFKNTHSKILRAQIREFIKNETKLVTTYLIFTKNPWNTAINDIDPLAEFRVTK